MPNAYAKMGLTAGLVLSFFSGLVSCYTIMLLVHLYEERKRRMVRVPFKSSVVAHHHLPSFPCMHHQTDMHICVAAPKLSQYTPIYTYAHFQKIPEF